MNKECIIINCCKEKSIEPNEKLLFRNYRNKGYTLDYIIKEWKNNINNSTEKKIKAKDLYISPRFKSDIDDNPIYDYYIFSSGYGIIRLDDYILPYSCTFLQEEGRLDSIDVNEFGIDSHLIWFNNITNKKYLEIIKQYDNIILKLDNNYKQIINKFI